MFLGVELTNFKTKVTILILIDGFLQYEFINNNIIYDKVTILILIDGFLQYHVDFDLQNPTGTVTILILIDGFLQSVKSHSNILMGETSQSLF